MKKTVLYVQADSNDADYVSEENEIDPKGEDYQAVKRCIEAIRNSDANHCYNWPLSEHIRETPGEIYPELSAGDIEIFNEYFPSIEGGTHSVECVELREVEILERLF